MLDLPILNVHLHACYEDWHHMTPTQQGRHCHSCDREVVDFTTATQADLAAARAASVDGRLCGRFRQEQLAAVPQVQLRPKLRRFVVALVLVWGLGLSGREAAAQVSQFEPTTKPQLKTPEELSPLAPTEAEKPVRVFLGVYVEVMPEFEGGIDALRAYLRQNLHYPDHVTVRGKVFVSFVVTKTGAITEAQVIKGVDPAFDAEALRVVQQMPAWKPARQGNKPVDIRYTLPFTFGETYLTTKEARQQARTRRRID